MRLRVTNTRDNFVPEIQIEEAAEKIRARGERHSNIAALLRKKNRKYQNFFFNIFFKSIKIMWMQTFRAPANRRLVQNVSVGFDSQ